MKKRILFFIASIYSIYIHGQVNGGEHIFEFLRLSQSPRVTAMGGYSISNPSSDINLAATNPALLRPEFNAQLAINYNVYYAGTRITNLLYAQHAKKINTTWAVGMQYLDYGSFHLYDNTGSKLGAFKANDFQFFVSASKSYLEKWRIGSSIKYAASNLYQNKAAALLTDIGLLYADTNSKWYMGAAIKNAGFQLIKYKNQQSADPLPIDLQLSVTKKFKKAPFSIGVLAHTLYKWDIRYDNPADNTDNQLLFNDNNNTKKEKNYFADKLFRHFIFSFGIHLGKKIEINAGYNHLRRSELAFADKKGLSGFSFGAGLNLNKFMVYYAQSYYHLTGPMHELGLTMALNKLFGIGGSAATWNEKYERMYK